MKKRFTVSLCLPLFLSLSGCASIVSDSRYDVSFESYPEGATVTVTDENGNDVHTAQTPFTATLEASDGFFDPMLHTATFELECHATGHEDVRPELDPWYLGNIILGGLLGMGLIDPATGAMWQLPEHVRTSLVEDGSCPE